MYKPTIETMEDYACLEYCYTLRVPFIYIRETRHYKIKLVYWMLKLLWKELRRQHD